MTQYCRYCVHARIHGDTCAYCEVKGKVFDEQQGGRANKCSKFILNEMDVFDPSKIYTPREKKTVDENQVSLWEV